MGNTHISYCFRNRKSEMTEDFEVRNEEIEKTLKDIGTLIRDQIPDTWGFTLLMFDYSNNEKDAGSMFYISSARREDMLKAMMEFIDKQQEDKIKN